MARDEVLLIVREIYFGPAQNALITLLLERLQEALLYSGVSDLIFHNPEELTPEQVVDEAMQREAEHAAKHPGRPTRG